MQDFSISQLRMVVLVMCHTSENGVKTRTNHPHVHFMHESQVSQFVEASIRLHHLRCENLWEIRVESLKMETVSYWWCHRELKGNHLAEAAQLNTWDYKRVWAHPMLLAEEAEAMRNED